MKAPVASGRLGQTLSRAHGTASHRVTAGDGNRTRDFNLGKKGYTLRIRNGAKSLFCAPYLSFLAPISVSSVCHVMTPARRLMSLSRWEIAQARGLTGGDACRLLVLAVKASRWLRALAGIEGGTSPTSVPVEGLKSFFETR